MNQKNIADNFLFKKLNFFKAVCFSSITADKEPNPSLTPVREREILQQNMHFYTLYCV